MGMAAPGTCPHMGSLEGGHTRWMSPAPAIDALGSARSKKEIWRAGGCSGLEGPGVMPAVRGGMGDPSRRNSCWNS